jgi:hypothetical protein
MLIVSKVFTTDGIVASFSAWGLRPLAVQNLQSSQSVWDGPPSRYALRWRSFAWVESVNLNRKARPHAALKRVDQIETEYLTGRSYRKRGQGRDRSYTASVDTLERQARPVS